VNPESAQYAVFTGLPDLQRSPSLLRHAPVDPLEQHRQLCSRYADLAVPCSGPNKPTLLEALAKQTRALCIPPDDLQEISVPFPEHKQVAGIRVKLQNLLSLRCQRVEPAPHVRDTRCKPNPRIAGNLDQTDRP